MLGLRQEAQAALFYEFSRENHVPPDHFLRSIDPELLIGMLLVGYCLGIRSKRRLCAEVQKQNSSTPEDWSAREIDPADAPRAQPLCTVELQALGIIRDHPSIGLLRPRTRTSNHIDKDER